MIFKDSIIIGVIGGGSMGSGIAQVALMAGHNVILCDTSTFALENAKANLYSTFKKLQEKGKIQNADVLINNITFSNTIDALKDCGLIIEAIIEKLEVKQSLFKSLALIVNDTCVLASNTSSLSITSIAASCAYPDRVIGLHFFNPAPLMALVEVIPAIQTNTAFIDAAKNLMLKWGKTPVIAKDTPGFIVNRVARPFYGEALRIFEEDIADMVTIDYAMTQIGNFKMGPFTLMDYIGHDVNFVVTETVFQAFYYDARYKPSFTQKRVLEAGWLGKKSGKGFYDYSTNSVQHQPNTEPELLNIICERIVAMLINEAIDALYLKVATEADLETAMTKGVNYPKGLFKWCDELGSDYVLSLLDNLYNTYHEDRYRASVLLRKQAETKSKFLQ